MTQILNVPMPADECKKLIESIMRSNSMIEIKWDVIFINKDKSEHKAVFNCFLWVRNYPTYAFRGWDMIITSITPIIPTYSIWDKVMILATGEIGSISKLRDEAREKPIEINNDTDQFYHRSEICKIA